MSTPPRAFDEASDANMLHFKATLKETISGLPKHRKNEATSDICTRADIELVFISMYMQMVGIVQGVKDEMTDMKNDHVKQLENRDIKINYLEGQIVKSRLELEKSQQYNNRDMFKICGIKEPTLGPNEREDTDTTVTKFFEKARINLPKEELSMTHRLPSRDSTRSKALLVKLRTRTLRNSVMRKKKEMRDNELLKGDYPDAFIVEHLTPMRAKVAYKLRNDENIEKCWTIDGRLKVVKRGAAPTDKPITVDSLGQLTLLGWTKQDITKLVFEA